MDARTVKRAWRMALPVLFVSLLLACVGTLAATPQQAHAKGTSTVWVITKIKDGSHTLSTLKYTKDGLIKSKKYRAEYDPEGPWFQTAYTYDAKHRMKSEKLKSETYAETYTYKLNKKGYVEMQSTPSGYTYLCTYSYNGKGQLAKMAYRGTGATLTYKYDSKGRVKSVGNNQSFKYDKKGTVSRGVYYGETVKYKNTYRSGRLVKRACYETTPGETGLRYEFTYHYQKKSVPKSVAKMVKAQQRNLINQTLPMEAIHG